MNQSIRSFAFLLNDPHSNTHKMIINISINHAMVQYTVIRIKTLSAALLFHSIYRRGQVLTISNFVDGFLI